MNLESFAWARLERATADDPLRVLYSAYVLGDKTAWDGVAWPEPLALRLARLPRVKALRFCPEDTTLGTPRPLTTLRGGNGRDVLAGRARVKDTDERDVTAELVAGAEAMLAFAQRERAELCVLLDTSDSCGTNIAYLGRPEEKRYQKGPGVAAALLSREGFPVMAQRDFATLSRVVAALDPTFTPDPGAFDFVDHPWYRETFGR